MYVQKLRYQHLFKVLCQFYDLKLKYEIAHHHKPTTYLKEGLPHFIIRDILNCSLNCLYFTNEVQEEVWGETTRPWTAKDNRDCNHSSNVEVFIIFQSQKMPILQCQDKSIYNIVKNMTKQDYLYYRMRGIWHFLCLQIHVLPSIKRVRNSRVGPPVSKASSIFPTSSVNLTIMAQVCGSLEPS